MKKPIQRFIAKAFTGKTNISAHVLRRLNIAAAVLLAAQAVMIVLFSAEHDVPVAVSFLTTDSLQSRLTHQAVLAPATHQLYILNMAGVVAAALLVAALARAAMASVFRIKYEAALKQRIHVWRWIEYAITGSLLIVTLGLLVGIYDVVSLLLLAALVVVMYLAGYVVEVGSKVSRGGVALNAGVGVAAGALALLSVGAYLIATNMFGNGHVNAYLYWLYAVVVIYFAKLIVNTHLTCTKKGKWANYMYGEAWFVGLSAVGLSVFAWLTFAAVLHP